MIASLHANTRAMATTGTPPEITVSAAEDEREVRQGKRSSAT
jgi:hypothetical protein